MNIKEKIKYFTENMNLKFAKNNVGKLLILLDEVKRYLKKELKGETNLQFDSQDLRSLTLAIEKIHKQTNKKISFVEIQKRLSNKKELKQEDFTKETYFVAENIYLLRDLQMSLGLLNYFAMILNMVELKQKQEKEESDEIFNDMVLMGIIEAM